MEDPHQPSPAPLPSTMSAPYFPSRLVCISQIPPFEPCHFWSRSSLFHSPHLEEDRPLISKSIPMAEAKVPTLNLPKDQISL